MYTVILRNNMKLDDLQLAIELKESIDSVAYTASIKIIVPEKFSKELLLMEGDDIEIIKNEGPNKGVVFKGIIWKKDTDFKHSKTGSLLCKERTIYIEESEDEYLFKEGTTATQRANQLCGEWGVPIGDMANTSVSLSKSPPQVGTIYGMMLDHLKETAQKGGGLFRYRFQNKLDLVEIGKNEKVHDISNVLENIKQTGSLDGAVTKVKVLGKKEDDKKSPVTGTFEKNSKEIGTIQKIIQDEKIEDVATAKQKAEALFSSGKRSISVSGIDIPEIRAGDKVELNGFDIYVTDVTHKLGEPGTMDLNLEPIKDVRSNYYAYDKRDS